VCEATVSNRKTQRLWWENHGDQHGDLTSTAARADGAGVHGQSRGSGVVFPLRPCQLLMLLLLLLCFRGSLLACTALPVAGG
jgi:hypothetical protein